MMKKSSNIANKNAHMLSKLVEGYYQYCCLMLNCLITQLFMYIHIYAFINRQIYINMMKSRMSQCRGKIKRVVKKKRKR